MKIQTITPFAWVGKLSSLFINGDSISFSISVFAVGNCFFTEKELESILDDPELLDGANKFIDSHRYLFKF